MSPLIAVYVLLIILLVAGVTIGYLRYRARRRTLTEGQEHVARPLDGPRQGSRM